MFLESWSVDQDEEADFGEIGVLGKVGEDRLFH
jgi:hypothetical protein